MKNSKDAEEESHEWFADRMKTIDQALMKKEADMISQVLLDLLLTALKAIFLLL